MKIDNFTDPDLVHKVQLLMNVLYVIARHLINCRELEGEEELIEELIVEDRPLIRVISRMLDEEDVYITVEFTDEQVYMLLKLCKHYHDIVELARFLVDRDTYYETLCKTCTLLNMAQLSTDR